MHWLCRFIVLGVIFSIPLKGYSRELYPNTYVGGVYQSYTGEKENSLVGDMGFGLNITSTPHHSHFRLLYGVLISASDGHAYIASQQYTSLLYSADAMLGFSVYPITSDVKIRPFLEATGLVGFKYLEITSPPTGVENQSTNLSYGYRLAIGLETSLATKYGLRITADYINNRAHFADVSDFKFDSFALSFGLFF